MEIFVSKLKVFKAIGLGLLMIGAAVLVLMVYQNLFLRAVGILAILLFGSMTIVLISRLFHTKPQVIINLEGIEDKRLNTGFIEWNEVNAVLLQEINHSQILILILKSPEKYYRRLPKSQLFIRKLTRRESIDSLKINFTELDKPIDDAWEFIENNVIKPRAEKGIHLMP